MSGQELIYQAPTIPTVLSVDPNAGFIVSASHHTFAPSWINYGQVAISTASFGFTRS
jgi:hypothetical protein